MTITESKQNTYIIAGLVISLILVVVDLIGKFASLTFTTWFKWLPSILLIIALIIACRSFGKERDGLVTFGNIFGYGFKITLFVTGIMVVYSLLSIYFIFPEMKDLAIEEARKQMEEKGTLSQDNIETALAMTRKLFIPFAIAGIIIGTLIIGAIGSLLGAAFTKKIKT
jgi:Protein of unknown function (DUF4199)